MKNKTDKNADTRSDNPYLSAAAKIHRLTLCLTFALLGGLTIFLITAVLLIRGGESIGPHLSLLGQYFPGYSVSWIGSLVGFFWGSLAGGFAGFVFGSVYNRIVDLRNGKNQ